MATVTFTAAEKATFPPGPIGPKGATGATGPQGPIGPMGPMGPSGSDGAAFNSLDAVRIVSPDGSDSRDGLSRRNAMATIQDAYDSLPPSGGTLLLVNGSGAHSVGSGFVGSHIKPCVFTSLLGLAPGAGHFPSYTSQGASSDQMPTITGTGATLITIAGDTVNIGRGWAFRGLAFDMRGANNTTGIWANGLNFLRVRDCNAEGLGAANNYLIRSNYTADTQSDASWYRIQDNNCRSVNLCSLADGETDGNCNNNQIFNNVVFNSAGSQIKMTNAQRCAIFGNNLEGAGIGVELAGVSLFNDIFWNGGEGTISPYVKFGSSCSGNNHHNFGSAGSALAVEDLSGGNFMPVRSIAYYIDRADSYTLEAGWQDINVVQNMTKATPSALTFPSNASVIWGIGKSGRCRQAGAGQVTFTPGAGVTLRPFPVGALKTAGQNAMVYYEKIALNEWALWGDLKT